MQTVFRHTPYASPHNTYKKAHHEPLHSLYFQTTTYSTIRYNLQPKCCTSYPLSKPPTPQPHALSTAKEYLPSGPTSTIPTPSHHPTRHLTHRPLQAPPSNSQPLPPSATPHKPFSHRSPPPKHQHTSPPPMAPPSSSRIPRTDTRYPLRCTATAGRQRVRLCSGRYARKRCWRGE